MRHRRRSTVVRAPEINWHEMAKLKSAPKESRPGDWACPLCQFHNYASRIVCKECTSPRPAAPCKDKECTYTRPAAQPETTACRCGDWQCARCHTVVYAWRDRCIRCRENRQGSPPIRSGLRDVPMLPRDWICYRCEVVNFAARKACFACRRPRKLVDGRV